MNVMSRNLSSSANATAERIVRHFQREGFDGITEALIIRIRLKKGDRDSVQAAFDAAIAADSTLPLQEYFEISPYGFFSQARDFAAARAEFRTDFGVSLRKAMPGAFFNSAPFVVDDPLATGTKYDAMLKLTNNVDGYALAIVLNDPNASFFDYLGEHNSYDWHKVMGDFGAAASAFGIEFESL